MLLQKIALLRGKYRRGEGKCTTSPLIMSFVQAHNQTIPILGRFHCLYYDMRRINLQKGRTCYPFCRSGRGRFCLPSTFHICYRYVEFVTMPYSLGFPPIPRMRQETIGKTVHTLIRMSIGVDAGFQERQSNDVVMNVMPIFTIIQQADTISPFTQINPAMGIGFKTSHIPGRITMCGTLNVTKLNLVGRPCVVNCQGKRRFQQGLAFVPVDLGGNIDARRAAPERNALRDTRRDVRTDNLDACAYRSLFDNTQRCYFLHRIRLLLIKEVNIPGIEIKGPVLISNKLVACLPGSKDFTSCMPVIKSANLSLRVDAKDIILILHGNRLSIRVCITTCRRYLRLN